MTNKQLIMEIESLTTRSYYLNERYYKLFMRVLHHHNNEQWLNSRSLNFKLKIIYTGCNQAIRDGIAVA